MSALAQAHPRDLMMRAAGHHCRGEWAEAEADYRLLLEGDSADAQVLHLYGLLLAQTRRGEQGLQLIDQALARAPEYVDALNSRGNALIGLGRFEEALCAYDRALALNPKFADALINRGYALNALHLRQAALDSFDRALAYFPQSFEANAGRGALLMQLNRFAEALESFDAALALKPADVDALCGRADALKGLGWREEAVAAYARALALAPARREAAESCAEIALALGRPADALAALAGLPADAARLNQRGNLLQDLGRYEEALAAYEGALAIEPESVVALHNRGNALRRLRRFADARADYDRALEIEPDHPDTHAKRGLLSLTIGDFASGFADYEYRWRAADAPARALEIDATPWRGEPIVGRSLIVYDEQGLGDVLMFCRYLNALIGRGARVTFFVRAHLAALMRMSFPRVKVISESPLDESFDFQCALMSLPLAFKTTLATVPRETPYLVADTARVAKWRDRIGPDGFRIGVAWRGSARSQRSGRSFPLQNLQPLAQLPGARLISLQKHDGLEDLSDRPSDLAIETLGEDFDAGGDAFLDAAAAMQTLDLVVAADSAIAHLAGALGRPAWLATPEPGDWRWLLDRTDSPWYPTLRLFRQTARGRWDGVIEAMAEALEAGRS